MELEEYKNMKKEISQEEYDTLQARSRLLDRSFRMWDAVDTEIKETLKRELRIKINMDLGDKRENIRVEFSLLYHGAAISTDAIYISKEALI